MITAIATEPTTYSDVLVDRHTGLVSVAVNGPRRTVVRDFGRISTTGVWQRACRAAGVESCRLVRWGWKVGVVLDFGGWDREVELTGITAPGAWLMVPEEMFGDFERLIEEFEWEEP